MPASGIFLGAKHRVVPKPAAASQPVSKSKAKDKKKGASSAATETFNTQPAVAEHAAIKKTLRRRTRAQGLEDESDSEDPRPSSKRPKGPTPACEPSPQASESEPSQDPAKQLDAEVGEEEEGSDVAFEEDWAESIDLLKGRSLTKERLDSGYEYIYFKARDLGLNSTQFVPFERVLRNGLKYHGPSVKDQPISSAVGYDNVVEEVQIFHVVCEYFPKFEEHIPWLQGQPQAVKRIAKFLSEVQSKACSDDIVRLNRNFFEAAGIPNPNYVFNQKKARGTRCVELAQYLLPPEWVVKLQAADDLKVYYNPDNLLPGFLQGRLQLIAHKLIFAGPDAAFECEKKRGGKGKQSLASKYEIADVTAESLVYSALLARYVLSAQDGWSEMDSDVSLARLSNKILTICARNLTWLGKLLEIWSERVFGTSNNHNPTMEDEEYDPTFAQFMRQDHEVGMEPRAYVNWICQKQHADRRAAAEEDLEEEHDTAQKAVDDDTDRA
ncbi:hypothetical protein C8T65DRAFT_697276 [Cerioporus squamosus]|nr:hypothetical protein C8T65DRAFT_697276 [Cerioporus squamosus]